MLFAFQQQLDPLRDTVLWSNVWSTVLAALPVVVLFWLLVPRRWLAPKAGAAGAVTAILIAIFVYRMPPGMAVVSFFYGALFGLLPVGWTILNAMLLYNITVETGQFRVVRQSVAGLSADARIQAILVAFAFGAFLEGAAGGGTPVAICAAIMVGLGFSPFLAAVLCLIANTSPVAFGGLSTPLIVLNGVTGLPTETLSVMAAHQLPFLSCLVPLYMIRCMCGWRQTWEVWPAILVSGGSFAVFQFAFATSHVFIPNLVLYPMTDIGAGILSLVFTAILLRFWRPRHEWHYDSPVSEPRFQEPTTTATVDGHAAGAAALLPTEEKRVDADVPLTIGRIALAWAPYAIMSVLLLATGFVRQKETTAKPGPGPVEIVPGLSTNYLIPVPLLHNEVWRDERLHDASRGAPKPESALFNFAWVTAPGSAVLVAAVLSMIMLRMSGQQIRRVIARTAWQMKIPIPTIACMLGLSYVTRYAGMDATLGVAFAATGVLYPFFAAILGWLGVFLTGTDAGSNALFGSLQKITATQVHQTGVFDHLSLGQAQVLISTANSTGGVMGKMIDAQSICVATAATHQLGKEADIFKAVIWHSIFLASVVGAMTLVQAYIYPFTHMVPEP
jgi:lactate permease